MGQARLPSYGFVGNDPISRVDRTGLDIWIGDRGPHQNINVGDPNGTYSSYSFALDGCALYNLYPFSQGIVYRDDPPNRRDESYGYLKTSADQDQRAINSLDALVGKRSFYGVFSDNCRSWSQDQFSHFKAAWPDTFVEPPPSPPSGYYPYPGAGPL
jgi:hypothetical protein